MWANARRIAVSPSPSHQLDLLAEQAAFQRGHAPEALASACARARPGKAAPAPTGTARPSSRRSAAMRCLRGWRTPRRAPADARARSRVRRAPSGDARGTRRGHRRSARRAPPARHALVRREYYEVRAAARRVEGRSTTPSPRRPGPAKARATSRIPRGPTSWRGRRLSGSGTPLGSAAAAGSRPPGAERSSSVGGSQGTPRPRPGMRSARRRLVSSPPGRRPPHSGQRSRASRRAAVRRPGRCARCRARRPCSRRPTCPHVVAAAGLRHTRRSARAGRRGRFPRRRSGEAHGECGLRLGRASPPLALGRRPGPSAPTRLVRRRRPVHRPAPPGRRRGAVGARRARAPRTRRPPPRPRAGLRSPSGWPAPRATPRLARSPGAG